MESPQQQDPAGEIYPAAVRLLRVRTFWVPLALVLLDGLLLLLSLLAAIVLLPVVLIFLMIVALARWLFGTVTGRRRRVHQLAQALESMPAGTTTLNETERQQIARRYRPCLVLFPESAELGPPYRTDALAHLVGADYHPRSVNLILRHVRLRRGRAQWLPDLPGTTSVEKIREYLGDSAESKSSFEIPWLHGGNPIKILRHLFPFGRQFRAHWAIPVPKADCGCSEAIWQRYFRIIEADVERPPEERLYERTIYARVLQGRELPEIGERHPLSNAVAVQYWWYMFYNDAWNRHQSDWEGITVYLLRAGDGSFQPLGAAYGTHDLGRWRRWQDLQRSDESGRESTVGEHPMVYVARGSHASYFEYNPNGYHPSMTRRLRVPFIGDYAVPSQFVIETRNAIDWVADPDSGAGNGERFLADRVEVMPPNRVLRDDSALRADDNWWWLAYRGLWGSPEVLPFFGGSGPRGPREQGLRWDNPFQWVMRECIADDLPYWVQMFAAWQHPAAEPLPTEAPSARS